MYETKIVEFADHFFAHINANKTNKNQSEKESSTEARKRRHSTDQDEEEEEEKMESKEGRTVKQKVILELHNPDNLSQFIQEFAQVTLDRDTNKTDAAEELKTIQENFRDFMARCNANPRNVHPDLNETELTSLAHVNPDTNFDEEEFHFHHQHEKLTREEFRAARLD